MPHDRKNHNKMQCLILTPIPWSARVPLDPLGERSSPPAAVPFAAAAMWGGLQPNATRFSNIGNSCGSCGGDLQGCAGPPGPALRATEPAISAREEAGVDVGRRSGVLPPEE